MVNPSAAGWIDKFFIEQKFEIEPKFEPNLFYTNVRKTGFIFGYIIGFDTKKTIDFSDWTSQEMSKVGLLNTLFGVYCLHNRVANVADFIDKSVVFYDEVNPEGFSFLKNLFPKGTATKHLEEIIDDRVQTNDNVISKNFSHLVTNALLFVDVLAFNRYLINGSIPDKYLKKIEDSILSIITLSLKTKVNKSLHDDLLIKLFEASVRYTKFSAVNNESLDGLKLDYFDNDLEKKYFIDLAGLTLWSDGIVEKNEAYFLYKLSELMQIDADFVAKSIVETNDFIVANKDEIPYFNYSNPVKSFYDNMTETVVKLILRNKKRLGKEIAESKELMVLLAKSTQRDLDKSEKKKVRAQLLDICKSVPSLTIFLIPGGSLLLPILIKFIPQLLPSSFNENLEEEH